MNIELLDEKRVLIDLCVEDMQLLSLEYKNLSMKSASNRKIINNLVRIAKIKTGFHTEEGATVFVEAMPYEGGCFILITLKEELDKYNDDDYIVFIDDNKTYNFKSICGKSNKVVIPGTTKEINIRTCEVKLC